MRPVDPSQRRPVTVIEVDEPEPKKGRLDVAKDFLDKMLDEVPGGEKLRDKFERLVSPNSFNPEDEVGVVQAEHDKVLAGPGYKWNLNGTDESKLADVRDQDGRYHPGRGVTATPGGELRVEDIRNPDRKDGRWDPFEFMPHFVFDKAEDNFPVSPSFDGDDDLDNNTSATDANDQSNYQDGVIGGRQELNGAFTVTQKGDYTVQTYSFFSAKDKGGESFHPKDYHTAQVYLQPGKDGKLEPKYLLTSFHHGTVLTPWDQVKKDKDGKPIVEVFRGTHATRPLGLDDEVPQGGLEITGDGQAWFDGEKLENRLGIDAFQGNIVGARQLDPNTPDGRARREMMEWGDVSLRPLLPDEVLKSSLLAPFRALFFVNQRA